MAELADAYGSGPYGATRGGSSPLVSTTLLMRQSLNKEIGLRTKVETRLHFTFDFDVDSNSETTGASFLLASFLLSLALARRRLRRHNLRCSQILHNHILLLVINFCPARHSRHFAFPSRHRTLIKHF